VTSKRILVIRLSAIGDVALALPVLQNACSNNSEVDFYFLCKPFAAKILPEIANLKVIEWDTSKQNVWAMAKRLRALKLDAILDLHDVLRTNLLRVALPFHHWYVFNKARHAKKQFLKYKTTSVVHTCKRYENVFANAGIALKSDHQFSFENDVDNSTLAYAASIQGNKKMIGIAPFAAHVQKSLPHSLLEKIIETADANIILFGGAHDNEKIEALCNKYQHVHHTRQLNFRQQIQLMKYLQGMLAVDSANMHLAALYGVPLVSIWGATHPDLGFAPVTSAAHIAVQIASKELPCRPCSVFGNKPCGNNENLACFYKISVQEIMLAINTVVAADRL
jgi:ADP-heptose:LPS heptosyltransferase